MNIIDMNIIAICSTFIILSLTFFGYKKIRSLVNDSAYPSRWCADHWEV